jgi:hypothetical protein
MKASAKTSKCKENFLKIDIKKKTKKLTMNAK